MKRFIASAAALVVAASIATPAGAYSDMKVEERLSARLIKSQAILRQRIPEGAMPVELLLRERKAAQVQSTGRTKLESATRVRAAVVKVLGKRYQKSDLTPRALRQTGTSSMLVVPPSIVQTGADVTVERLTRRTIMEQAMEMNAIKL